MPNHHDQNFKALMQERSFFEPFLKTYLPEEIKTRLDWSSIEFYKMCGSHEEEKTGNSFESDLVYLAKMGNEQSLLWLHSEHQSRSDRIMPLRILNYQVAELLNFSKANRGKKLPSIVTLIYHQGKRPWTHSLELKNLFAEPELAMRYFGHPILVDLPTFSDKALLAHPNIGPIEMVLKHIRQKDFEKNLRIILSELRTADDKPRRIVLKYLIEVADAPQDKLLKMARQCLTHDEETVMTVGDQLRAEGMELGIQKGLHQGLHQGIQKGIQQGLHEGEHKKACDFAKKLLLKGFPIEEITDLTDLPLTEIQALQQTLTH